MADIQDWLKIDGLSDEKIKELTCPNGSFTCGLFIKLGLEERCNFCRKTEKKTLSDNIIFDDALSSHYDKGYIMEENVKEAIKDFIDWIISEGVYQEGTRNKAKEIFGERLI